MVWNVALDSRESGERGLVLDHPIDGLVTSCGITRRVARFDVQEGAEYVFGVAFDVQEFVQVADRVHGREEYARFAAVTSHHASGKCFLVQRGNARLLWPCLGTWCIR